MKDAKLEKLIKEFYEHFNEAQRLRQEILDYISEVFDINADENWEYFENDNDFCFGLDMETIDGLENGDDDLLNELRN